MSVWQLTDSIERHFVFARGYESCSILYGKEFNGFQSESQIDETLNIARDVSSKISHELFRRHKNADKESISTEFESSSHFS